MNKTLLGRPKPYEHESLANYTFRLAEANSCQPKWILEKFGKPRWSLSNLNLFHEEVINRVSKVTAHPVQTITDMTIHDKHASYTSARFCPECLLESQYERIYWNNSKILTCEKHEIYLIGECTICQKKLTSEAIINGKCTCGYKRTNLKAVPCTQKDILDNQLRMYKALGIISYNDDFYEDFGYLPIKEYPAFFDFLKEMINSGDKMKEKITSGHTDILYELKTVKLIEQMTKDWPKSFIDFLDDFNQLKHNDYFIRELGTTFSPLDIIPYSRWAFVNVCLLSYLKKTYSLGFLSKRLKNFLIEDDFLPIQNANIIICDSDILSNLAKSINNSDCIPLAEITNILISLLQFTVINISTEGYSTIINIYKAFKELDISIKDILYMIKVDNIEVRIAMPMRHLGDFYIPTLKSKEILLRLALSRVVSRKSLSDGDLEVSV